MATKKAPSKKPAPPKPAKTRVFSQKMALWPVQDEFPVEESLDDDEDNSLFEPPSEPTPPAAPSPEQLAAMAALKEVLLPLLKQSLTIQVENGSFVNPNDRVVRVLFDGECIAEDSFSVVQAPEYEG